MVHGRDFLISIKSFLFFCFSIVALFTVPFLLSNPVQAVSCGVGAVTQNGIKVIPSHGKAFYIDTGTNPKLDAGYVGYQVLNQTGATKNNLWIELSDFTGAGNIISLANTDDSAMQLASVANNATSTAYFLIKATGATNSVQTHTLKVYDGRPDVSGSSLLYSCTYSFSAVKETITAGSNSVNSIIASNTSPSLGQTVVVTVNGTTGTVGNGNSPDYDMIWLAPAAVSSWPTRALRLENVSITFTRTGSNKTHNNRLFFSGVDLVGNGSQSNTYVATYTFRVIGRPQGIVKVLPVSQISSGTQVKHANVSGAVDITFPSFSVSASVTKIVTATTSLQTTNIDNIDYVGVPYRIQITSSTSTVISIDEIVDIPSQGTIFKTGSASTTDLTRSGVSITDPVYVSSESEEVPRPYHFVGPFSFNSTKNATLDYVMWVPAGLAENVAYSKTGDLVVGATPSSISKVIVTSNGTASIEAATSTQSIDPTAITQPVTNITSTGGSLNGTVDPHGNTPLFATFEYGTNSNLSGSTVVTATTPTSGDVGGGIVPTNVSVNLSGLSINTTYYYRVKAGSVVGDILSFSTLAVQAAPTVSIQAVSDLTLTSAALNGTINPNLTNVTAIKFIYGTNSLLSSGNTIVTLQDADSANGGLQVGGSSVQSFSTPVSSLTGGTTYYYKLQACTSSSGSYPNITCSVTVDSSIASFVASASPLASTTNATSIGSSIATINGVINANYADTSSLFTYGTSLNLSSGNLIVSASAVAGSASTTVSANIIGLTPATTYYFKVSGQNNLGSATGTILSFTTASVNRTLTIDGGSYVSTYVFNTSSPTVTSTPSDGAGTKTYSSFTTDVCIINSVSGEVTFVNAGTCTLGSAIAAHDNWTDASSPTVSFTITAVSRTITLNVGSISETYVYDAVPPTIVGTLSVGSGTVYYETTTSSVCSIDESTGVVTFLTLDTCTVRATSDASNGYSSATSEPLSFNIYAINRTISFDSNTYQSNYNLLDSAPILEAQPSTGIGTITYTSINTDKCAINSLSGVVTFVSTGTCTFGASIVSNGVYTSANTENISFTVTAANRTLLIDSESYLPLYTATALAPTIFATPSAGAGIITYSSLTTSVCTIDPSTGTVSFVNAGTCTLGASIATNTPYDFAIAPNINFIVSPEFNNQSTQSHSRSSGSSVQSQVSSLISIGNQQAANNLMRMWPNLFATSQPFVVQTVVGPEPCPPYLNTYIRKDGNNNAEDVKKLQTFLNTYEGELLIVDGVYKNVDVLAVNRFQSKHSDVLSFWNLKYPTGYVYIATQKSINKIYCEKTNHISCPYFTEYVDPGNSGAEIVKIKAFLNNTQGAQLNLSSNMYDSSLTVAVNSFQKKYASSILTPWGFGAPTGRWYQSTRKAANDILGCFAPVRLDNGKVLE